MRDLLKRMAPAPLIRIYRTGREICLKVLCVGCRIYPICGNRVVLCNVWGYGDNAKYVTEELLHSGFDGEIIFITNHPETCGAPEGVRVLKNNTYQAIKALATAKVWVDNNRKEPYILKRKGQYYIQLWHGGIALKRIEGDCVDLLGTKYRKNAERDTKMTDLYVSNSSFCTKMYRRAFSYEGEILECGSPRMDILLHPDPEKELQIKEQFGIASDTRMAVYAPTYRGAGCKGKEAARIYDLDGMRLCNALSERFGGTWVVLVRLHPLASADARHILFGPSVIDASGRHDLYELLAASDVLITDYSNTMFEFAISAYPVFLYANDVSAYQKERGLYFDYYTLPFSHASSNEELLANIRNYDPDVYRNAVQEFLRPIAIYEDGYGAREVVKRIRRECNGRRKN